MDMSDYLTQWGCPYCSRVCSSKDDLKEHLEPNRQLIVDLLSQLRQALSQSCQQILENTEGSTVSDGGNDVDLDHTKRSHVEEPWRCPHPDCETSSKAFNRRDHLTRHFKIHVSCNITCECKDKFVVVDQFVKHVPKCLIVQGYNGGIKSHEMKYRQVMGTLNTLNKNASQALSEQLTSQSEKATKLLSKHKTPNATVQSLKRKRSSLAKRTRHKISGQNSMLEDYDSAVQLGPLDNLDSIPNYTYHAGKEPEAIQAFGDSIPLYLNESTNGPPLTQNTINDNSIAEINNFKHRQPSQIGNGGVDCTNFSNESGAEDWNSLYTASGEKDWNSLYTASGEGDWNSLGLQ